MKACGSFLHAIGSKFAEVRRSFVRYKVTRALDLAIASMLHQREFSADHVSISSIRYVIGNDPPADIYVFYRTNADLVEARRSGAIARFPDQIARALGRADPNSPTGILGRFEYDSDENVHDNYRGSYFLRLR